MLSLLALTSALASSAFAISTLSVKGSKIYNSDGNQFYMKGIAYQLSNDDPLADGKQCSLDAALMKTLGVNSIRVYHVDPTANHDSCMSTFADAGIYAWIDLDTFSTYILGPGQTVPQWTQKQYDAYSKVMDTFHGYDNVAGFFVGNEVLTTAETSIAAPYVKAAARDMKAYRDKKGYRKFPIGYTAADVSVLRPMLQNYLACGDSADAIDVYGLNAYEWCGKNTYEGSGYNQLQKNASQYNIPIFFSETGCIEPPGRSFDDQAAILGPEMDGTWSGAIVYEWIQEQNTYGIISYGPSAPGTATSNGVIDGYTRTGTPTPINPDFSNLSKQWATLSPTGTPASAYTPSLSAPACPAFTSGAWSVDPSAALPTLGQVYSGGAVSGGFGSVGAGPTGSTSGGGGSGGSGGSGSSSATTTSQGSGAAAQAGVTASSSSTKSGAAVNLSPTLAPVVAGMAFAPFIALL